MEDREKEKTVAPEVGEGLAGSFEDEDRETRHTGLEQLREIVFGASYRELERRMVRASALTAVRIQQLEQRTERRVAVLEAHFRGELETLTARNERGFTEASDALRALSQEHREAVDKLTQRVTKGEDTSVRGLRDLRQELLEQAKASLDEVQRLHRELLARLRHELDLAEGEFVEEQGEAEMGPRH
jgi:hypothetical protein